MGSGPIWRERLLLRAHPLPDLQTTRQAKGCVATRPPDQWVSAVLRDVLASWLD